MRNHESHMLTLLRNRRSIRKFRDRPIEKEKVENLIEALLRSPSSRRLNPWEFILVDDSERLRELSQCKPHGAAFIADAPLAIVVAADPNACDVWIEDSSIASILVQMTAQDLGLGSCWVQVRLRKNADGQPAESRVKELLKLPGHYHALSIIAVGYPDESPEPHPLESLKRDKIHWNVNA